MKILIAALIFIFLLPTSIFSKEKVKDDKTTQKKIKIIKISMMDLKSEVGLDKGVVNMLYEVILAEFQKYKNLSIISKTDINTMLQHEAQKELAGCDEDSCMAEIGGALGVDKLVIGNVGKIGNSYTVTLKLMNIREATVEKRVYKTIPGDETKLIPLVKVLANDLFKEYHQYRTEPIENIDLSEKSSTKWITWTSFGIAGVSLILGGYFYYKADDYQQQVYDGKNTGNEEFNDLNDQYKSYQMWRNIFLITGTVGLISGTVFYFIEGDDKNSSDSSFRFQPMVTKDRFFVTTSFNF